MTVGRCKCGHGSDCHAASDHGIHECQDCACVSFHWDGGEGIKPTPGRHWVSGKPIEVQEAENHEYWRFVEKCAAKVKRWPAWKRGALDELGLAIGRMRPKLQSRDRETPPEKE